MLKVNQGGGYISHSVDWCYIEKKEEEAEKVISLI